MPLALSTQRRPNKNTKNTKEQKQNYVKRQRCKSTAMQKCNLPAMSYALSTQRRLNTNNKQMKKYINAKFKYESFQQCSCLSSSTKTPLRTCCLEHTQSFGGVREFFTFKRGWCCLFFLARLTFLNNQKMTRWLILQCTNDSWEKRMLFEMQRIQLKYFTSIRKYFHAF